MIGVQWCTEGVAGCCGMALAPMESDLTALAGHAQSRLSWAGCAIRRESETRGGGSKSTRAPGAHRFMRRPNCGVSAGRRVGWRTEMVRVWRITPWEGPGGRGLDRGGKLGGRVLPPEPPWAGCGRAPGAHRFMRRPNCGVSAGRRVGWRTEMVRVWRITPWEGPGAKTTSHAPL